MKLGHYDVTSAHRVILRDAVHCPCAIALPTSPSARPLESAHAGRRHHSIQGVGTAQRAFLAAVHAIACNNPHTGLKKVRRQHELHALSTAVGSTSSVVGKLFWLRNHNDTGGVLCRSSPERHSFTGQMRHQRITIKQRSCSLYTYSTLSRRNRTQKHTKQSPRPGGTHTGHTT